MGKGTPQAPQAPAFNPVDIPDAMARALSYDVAGYDWSDNDFLSRFPGLVAQRNQQLDSAYNELTGPLNPTVEGSFLRQGLGQGIASTGSGDPLSGLGMTEGSAGRNAASASFANSVLAKQDYDRSFFDQLLAANPQRQFGLGGGDVAGLAALNTGGLNAFNQMDFQSQLAGIYGQGAQSAQTGQNIAALGALLGRLNFGG